MAFTRTSLYFSNYPHYGLSHSLEFSPQLETFHNAMNSQAPQLMDYPEIAQSPLHGSQTSEGSASIAPCALCRRFYNFSNPTCELPQHDIRPGAQSMSSGRSELFPEPPSLPAHLLDFQCSQPSAPPLQASSSVPPSQYAPSQTQLDLASPESQSLQQYTPSQTSNQYALSSSYFEVNTPSVHSYQRYGGGGTPTSFRGSEGSRSGHGWPTCNGDGTLLTSMDTSGRRPVQGSSTELYSSGAELGNDQGPNILSGMCSWGSPRVPGGANVSGNHHRSDGMRYSFHRRSATDQNEGLTVDPSLIWNPVPVKNHPAHQKQGIHSQEISWPVDQSARGIDPSLQSRDFPEMLGSFVEDANNTNTDAGNSQNEGNPRSLGFYGSHRPSNPSALAPNHAPESRDILSSIAPNLTPHIDHGAHSHPAPESSEKCQVCDIPFSNSENRRRHMREQHKAKNQFVCQLVKDGSVCPANVTVTRRNRRRHVERVHRRESMMLPPPSGNHRANPRTDKMLNEWFDEVQQ